MQTEKEIIYTQYPYGTIATIPKGTKLIPATNLPNYKKKKLYWAELWKGMSEKAESWARNYGFLIELE